MLTETMLTDTLTALGYPPDGPLPTPDTVGVTTRYAFSTQARAYVAAISQPDDLTSVAVLRARVKFTQLAAEKGLCPPIVAVDESPAGLPAGSVLYIAAAPDGMPIDEATYTANPLPLAHFLRRLHGLAANRPFEALAPLNVEHPQLKGLHPLTPRSALAWYLPPYAGRVAAAMPVAQTLAALWFRLKHLYTQTQFDDNMLQVTHNDLHWSNMFVTVEGDWQVAHFDTALIDDPMADFIWALAPLTDDQRRQLLAAYGIPDFAQADWLAHWRIRYIHRLLEQAAEAAYQAFAALTGDVVPGFPMQAGNVKDWQAAYLRDAGQAAELLEAAPPSHEAWA